VDTDAQVHEQELVRRFVIASKRPRLLFILGNPKRRREGLNRMAHFDGLDPRWCHRIVQSQQLPTAIRKALRARGAPETCYVISEDSRIDGSFLPLAEALETIVDSFCGGFLSCIPGTLAYFQTETPGERFILEKRTNPY